MNAYRDYLNQEIKTACKAYEEAKENAINELKSLTVNIAVNYNTELIALIKKITEHAVKIDTLSKAFAAYENEQNNLYAKIEIYGI